MFPECSPFQVRHIYRGIKEMGGYCGERIHSTFVDEVQDFTEAEMKLIMSVSAAPNGFFLTGECCFLIHGP
jgi:hypothetical protein